MVDWIRIVCFLSLSFVFGACQHGEKEGNHLAEETSPYLLQHAQNPVDWHPWGPEALKKARREDRLILISIGYAACHWCHVMEEESFTDEEVAAKMNQHFVSIKVDREERPDIDQVYMAACQLTSKNCGWPLHAIALPDGRPIWIGTYFPKEEWLKVLSFFADAWPKDRKKMESFALQLHRGIAGLYPDLQPSESFSAEQASILRSRILAQTDPERGGRQGSPKFPMPAVASYLLHDYAIHREDSARLAVETQLKNMAAGGIYDQLAGGFARYSVDDQWLVPHFEKMLYDNAQLARLYAEAYQLSGENLYKVIASETLNWVLDNLQDPAGGFYSSLDADSEGEEGLYYTWTQEEWDSALPQAPLWLEAYLGLSPGGNFEDGRNILHHPVSRETALRESGLSPPEFEEQLARARTALLKERNKRIPPATDDKIITAWNGLMISALCQAYRAFGEEKWLQAALRSGHLFWDQAWEEQKVLFRIHKNGKSSIPGFLDDYANLAGAFLDLYEVTFDPTWIERADVLVREVQQRFAHPSSPLYYYRAADGQPLVVRSLEIQDQVIPSSNAVLARALHRLGLLLDQPGYREQARDMLAAVLASREFEDNPTGFAHWGELLLELAFPFYEVAIVGPAYPEKKAALQARYLPQALFLGGDKENDLPLLQEKEVEGKTMIYVCLDKLCKLPVKEPSKALSQITD